MILEKICDGCGKSAQFEHIAGTDSEIRCLECGHEEIEEPPGCDGSTCRGF
jgi:hypothetical protein